MSRAPRVVFKPRVCGTCRSTAIPGETQCHNCGAALPPLERLEPVAARPEPGDKP